MTDGLAEKRAAGSTNEGLSVPDTRVTSNAGRTSLRSGGVNWADAWLVLLASLVIVGFALRITEATYDRYYRDEYALMVGVDGDFADYAAELQGVHSIQFVVHYWLTYRLLGDSLFAYRFVSLLAALALLILVPLWLRRFWPSRHVLLLVVLMILVVNKYAVFLGRYSVIGYSLTLLLSVAFFFLFLRLVESPLGRRFWVWFSLLSVPAAFFSNIFLLIPMMMGSFLVIVFRWWRLPESRGIRDILGWIRELLPLVIYPIVYVIKQIVFPITAWGPATRPDQVHLFFESSGYPQTLTGMIEFVANGTYSLFWSILAPVRLEQKFVQVGILGIAGILVLIAVVQIVRRREDWPALFTLSFVVVTTVGLAVGGLLSLSPYGTVRYVPYLTVPLAILVGLGASWLHRWVFAKRGQSRIWEALMILLAVGVLLGCVFLVVTRSRYISFVEESDEQAMSWVRDQQADLTLVDSHIAPMVYAKAPEVYERADQMGWGEWGGRDIVPPEIAQIIDGTGQDALDEDILVVLSRSEFDSTETACLFEDRYPVWHDLLETYFDLDVEVDGVNVEGRLYRRR